MSMFPRTRMFIVVLAAVAFAATPAAHAESPAAKAAASLAAAGTPKTAIPSGFALIPRGEFTMGDALVGNVGDPQHKVNVSAFYMQKTEVSKAEWDEVRAWGLKNGYTDLPEGYGKAKDHPVQGVSWYEVVKWCNAKSVKEGMTPCYYTDAEQMVIYKTSEKEITNAMVKWGANGYRLPTEAEWEKAARGGLSGKRFPWGDVISHSQANFRNDGQETYQKNSTGFHPTYEAGNKPYTSPVGSFAANDYGLYDMAGNVFEWCWDVYGKYPSALEADPHGASSGRYKGYQVYRGGSWGDFAVNCRVADRVDRVVAWTKSIRIGFRLACSSVPYSQQAVNKIKSEERAQQ